MAVIAGVRAMPPEVKAAVIEAVGQLKDGGKAKAVALVAVEAEKAKREKDHLVEDLERTNRRKEQLAEKVAEQQARELQLQEDIAEKVASDESKIARLQAALRNRQKDVEEKDEFILELKQKNEVKDIRMESVKERLDAVWAKAEYKEENLDMIRQELEEKKGQKDQLDRWACELQEQLEQAWAARRVSDSRCEDYRTALDAQESRYEKLVEDLRQEIRYLKRHSSSASVDADGGDPDNEALRKELLDLRRECKKMEERNILQNVLEWKEVQFRCATEELEQQLAQQAAEFEKERNASQQDLLSRLEGQADVFRQKLTSATSGTDASQEETPTGTSANAQGSFSSVLPSLQAGKRDVTVSECSSGGSRGNSDVSGAGEA